MGREIRRLRRQAGLSQDDLGRSVGMTYGMISAIERGIRGVKPDYLKQIDAHLSTDGKLIRLWESLNKDRFPSWLRDVLELERQAVEVREWHPVLIPGLLQTEEYARTIVRNGRPTDMDDEVDGIVAARMARQDILKQERPPLLLVVLDETVIRRPVGGADVMRPQLDELLKMSHAPRVTIQIVPFTAEQHPGLSGPFRLLQDSEGNDVLYLEHVLSGTPVEERDEINHCARLYSDLRGVALPPEESRDLIERAKGELQ
ncbi:helix-turn-helix domain-containing protein [Salinactinospora qingdaonensis]